MYTDDNGIVRFEALDNIAPLQVNLNAALESVSDSLDSTARIFVVANAAERDALGVERPQRPLYAHRLDTGNLERNTGNQWEIVVQGPIGWDYLPARIASGRVDIAVPSGQTVASTLVSFPAGRFTSTPNVALATRSTASTLINYSVSGISTVACTINVHRTSTATTIVEWVAVQA